MAICWGSVGLAVAEGKLVGTGDGSTVAVPVGVGEGARVRVGGGVVGTTGFAARALAAEVDGGTVAVGGGVEAGDGADAVAMPRSDRGRTQITSNHTLSRGPGLRFMARANTVT